MKMNKDESNFFQMGGDMIAGLDGQNEGRWQICHWLGMSEKRSSVTWSHLLAESLKSNQLL